MIKLTRKHVNEMAEAVWESLAHRGTPVIYQYCGKINVSRGDMFGVAAPVHNGDAEILVNTETLKMIFDGRYTIKKEAADVLYEILAASIAE